MVWKIGIIKKKLNYHRKKTYFWSAKAQGMVTENRKKC